MEEYNNLPPTGYSETKHAVSGGFVDLLGPGTESTGVPILEAGGPGGQTVTKINIDRNSVGIGFGGYMCPKPDY